VSRFTVANVLVLIGVLAAGLAAMRDGSDLAAQTVFTLTLASLFVGLLGAIVCRGSAAWAGFALFGWGYMLSACLSPLKDQIQPRLLTTALLAGFSERLQNLPPKPQDPPFQQAGKNGNINGKIVDGQWVPMTPEEIQIHGTYLAESRYYWSQYNAKGNQIHNSRQIGHLLLSLIFALIGAVLGRFLAIRCRSSATTPHPSPAG
jgi:hypothetical protein